MAGVLRLDPAPFSLRSLVRMLEANRRESWDHTSHLIWIVAEVNRGNSDRKHPFSPLEFNPTHKGRIQKGEPMTKDRLRAKAAAWRKSKGLEEKKQ